MTRTFIVAAAAASLMTGTALAQTSTTTKPVNAPQATTSSPSSPPAATTNTNTTMPNTANSAQTTGAGAAAGTMGGIAMAASASQPVKFATTDTADLMSSKLVGVNVYNKQNEKVGEISDIAIDGGKTVSGVVLSVGGFLGLGESYVMVEPSSLALNNDNGTWKAYIDTSKDSLKNAPKFTYQTADRKS